MNKNKIIKVISDSKIPYAFSNFYCKITERLNEFRICIDNIDPTYYEVMRTYLMIPEPMYDKWAIPITLPGATRGHIQVVPSNGYWKVIKVSLYNDSAIDGVSIIGCYKPEVLDILSEFKGTLIDFGKFNPN